VMAVMTSLAFDTTGASRQGLAYVLRHTLRMS